MSKARKPTPVSPEVFPEGSTMRYIAEWEAAHPDADPMTRFAAQAALIMADLVDHGVDLRQYAATLGDNRPDWAGYLPDDDGEA